RRVDRTTPHANSGEARAYLLEEGQAFCVQLGIGGRPPRDVWAQAGQSFVKIFASRQRHAAVIRGTALVCGSTRPYRDAKGDGHGKRARAQLSFSLLPGHISWAHRVDIASYRASPPSRRRAPLAGPLRP